MDDLSLGKWTERKKKKRQMAHLVVKRTAINLMMALAIRH